MGLFGVDAGGGVDFGEIWGRWCVGEVERVMHGVWAFAYADSENNFDIGCVGSAEDCVAVVGVEVEMGVGVDQMHRLYQGYRGSRRMAA